MNEEIIDQLSETDRVLLVRGLSSQIELTPGQKQHFSALGLIDPDGPPYDLSVLGDQVATEIQAGAASEDPPEEVSVVTNGWSITMRVLINRLSSPTMDFLEAITVNEEVEALAVSMAHSATRSKYPTATSIRAVSRFRIDSPQILVDDLVD